MAFGKGTDDDVVPSKNFASLSLGVSSCNRFLLSTLPYRALVPDFSKDEVRWERDGALSMPVSTAAGCDAKNETGKSNQKRSAARKLHRLMRSLSENRAPGLTVLRLLHGSITASSSFMRSSGSLHQTFAAPGHVNFGKLRQSDALYVQSLALSLKRPGHFDLGEDTDVSQALVAALQATTLTRTCLTGGSGVPIPPAGEEARRSHVRRLLNAIIRRRNQVNPTELKGVEDELGRFDASSLEGGRTPNGDILDGEKDRDEASGPPQIQKRVLILMSDTGGGHRASAEALKATFQLEYGNKYEVTIVDLWKDHTPYPFNQLPKSYSFLVKHEALWRMAFYATKPRFVHQPQMAATSAFVAREVAKMLDIYRPNLIVSVHPLMQHIPLRVLRSRGLLHRIPFATVITDLTTCHPTWFHKWADMCFCPTKEVAQRALKAGLTPPQLRVHGLPVRPTFSRPPSMSKYDLRLEMGMDTDLPTVLLIGGGEGMGPVEATARALARTLGASDNYGPEVPEGDARPPLGQLVVVCGRNKKLKATLDAIDWPMPTLIEGFVTNMPDLMGACDCIITKAGPGTIAESLIRGLPLILNDFIAGQEVGNVPYVVDNGAGIFCDKPMEIAQIVANWFGPKAGEFAVMSGKARQLGRADAVFRIVRDLDGLACGEKLVVQKELALLQT